MLHAPTRRAARAIRLPLWIFLLLGPGASIPAAPGAAEPGASPGDGYRCVGSIRARHAREIRSSNWSIGAETMDRDYTIYENWRRYLGPLGVKKARIQSGWAKTEKKRGVYAWEWMDEIVHDMVEQGVEPWVCLCYGNPIYPGGGGTGLGGGLVSSEEALRAWERYVAAFVERYREQVDEWEIWNEPRTGRGKGAVQYARFVIRTAETIRRLQEEAEILFAAGGSFDVPFARQVLEHLREEDKLGLVDAVIYHPYAYNPDDRYDSVEELRRIAMSFAPHIGIRQGENGAPSRRGGFGAIAKADWTERSQAKWALRRLLGDLGRDIPSSYFAICDMRYPSRVNYKGLLAINEDRTVHHVKLGYYAVQHLTALFDDTVQRIPDFHGDVSSGSEDTRYSLFGYRRGGKAPIVTLWRSSDRPGERPDIERVRLTVTNVSFTDPVWVDLLSGGVYSMDDRLWDRDGDGTVFRSLPVHDSPVVVADRTALSAVLVRSDGANEKRGPAPLVLEGTVTLQSSVRIPGVRLALEDLSRDLERVLATAPSMVPNSDAQIVVLRDEGLKRPEAYRIDVGAERVRIAGSDTLGIIYGIYRFSRTWLGVDPYWYFKDLEPRRRDHVLVPQGVEESKAPTFRYRGWFVNDEDLLTGWKDGGGVRHIDYPFYGKVVPVQVLDRIFEALLRAGGNLVIPASFVDVRNEPEARLVRRAVERGLYVTQHHIEPLGVSHYGFENYWESKGKEYPFAYGSHPERVREAWRVFAGLWRELAGDKVVWQLGLRGKGDRAIWQSDASVDAAEAGRLISKAIHEQWEIVRSVDPRPTPPATVTLWLEGSRLMSQGQLTFPEDITIIFCDHGPSQRMQADFEQTVRSDEFRYGAYYHIGFWSTGPHLLQGSTPYRIRREFDRIVARGDTHYSIVNVCNVREHVLGIQVATEIMNDHEGWHEPEFWNRFAPTALHEYYETLLDCLFPLDDERIIQDGALFAAAKKMLSRYAKGRLDHGVLGSGTAARRKTQLNDAIRRLDSLVDAYPAGELTDRQRAFHDTHLRTQARMMREMYSFYLAVIEAADEPERLTAAEAALAHLLQIRETAARGKWTGWYRGDSKVNVPALLKRTREAVESLKQLDGVGGASGESGSRGG